MWSSSEAPGNDSWVPSELRAPEAARLVERKVLIAPERTGCAISAQAMAAMGSGAMVSVTAYGDTLMLSSPKGQPAWRLSLERRSTATRPIGADMEPPRKRGFHPFSLF